MTGIIRALQLLVTECQAHVSALSCAVVLGDEARYAMRRSLDPAYFETVAFPIATRHKTGIEPAVGSVCDRVLGSMLAEKLGGQA